MLKIQNRSLKIILLSFVVKKKLYIRAMNILLTPRILYHIIIFLANIFTPQFLCSHTTESNLGSAAQESNMVLIILAISLLLLLTDQLLNLFTSCVIWSSLLPSFRTYLSLLQLYSCVITLKVNPSLLWRKKAFYLFWLAVYRRLLELQANKMALNSQRRLGLPKSLLEFHHNATARVPNCLEFSWLVWKYTLK